MVKKVLYVVALFVLLLGTYNISASEFVDEPIVFDVEYTQKLISTTRTTTLTSRKYGTYSSDEYRLIIPSGGLLTITGYIDENDDADPFASVIILDSGHSIAKCGFDITGWKKEPLKREIRLEEGEYIVRIDNTLNGDAGEMNPNHPDDLNFYYHCRPLRYHFTFSFEFDSTTNVKLTSPKKGSVKITAPKGDKINGYEIRYKKESDKKWTTIKVETNKTLNKTIKGFTSKKEYVFQVRKYVLDQYEYIYYSNWTEEQQIKVK